MVLKILAGLCLVVGVVWFFWWRQPERQIARRLDKLAETASFNAPLASLEQLRRAGELADFFDPEVTVDLNASYAGHNLRATGRETLRNAYLAVTRRERFSLGWADREIQTGKGEAVSRVVARVRLDGANELWPVELEWRKVDGAWLITAARSLETFSR